MPSISRIQSLALTPVKNLLTDVEHRSIYTLAHCELNVFETYRPAAQFGLSFRDTVITSMVRGKKVMHLPGMPEFEYFPGETVLAPAGTAMEIDFPEAEMDNPTQCIALTLDANCVGETIHYLNESFPRESTGWQFNYQQSHLKNSPGLAAVIDKMVGICREGNQTKDILADLSLKELIVRLVQLQALDAISGPVIGSGAMDTVIQFIRNNLSGRLDSSILSRLACMSKPTFFRMFRREFGMSPAQFIIRERIRMARQLLSNTSFPINRISSECGFEDVNHFIRIFRQIEGVTPGGFRKFC